MFDTEYVDHQAAMQKLQDFVYVLFHFALLHIKYADALYTFSFSKTLPWMYTSS